MKKLLFFLLCISTVATAQNKIVQKSVPAQAPKDPKVVGVWELNYIEGADVATMYKKKKPKIAFDPKLVLLSGNNGCNDFSGQIKVENHKIIFEKPFVQTQKACIGDGEALFMDALAKVKTYAMTDSNKLDLIAGDRGIMQFTKVVKNQEEKSKKKSFLKRKQK